MFIDSHDQLVARQFQLFRRAFHDADIGLMRNQPVDIRFGLAGLGQRGTRRFIEYAHRKLENRLPVHLQQWRADHGTSCDLSGNTEQTGMLAVGMKIGCQDARCFAGFEHHGTSAVAEQHTRRAIVEIQNAREHFGADDQRALGGAGPDQRIRNRQRIDEAAAHSLHVERGATCDAEFVLEDGGGRGENHVRRRRRDDDQVDLRRVATCRLQRMPAGFERQVAAGDVRRSEMARTDTGALHDPLIGGFNPALCQLAAQIVVGDAVWREVAAGAGNA